MLFRYALPAVALFVSACGGSRPANAPSPYTPPFSDVRAARLTRDAAARPADAPWLAAELRRARLYPTGGRELEARPRDYLGLNGTASGFVAGRYARRYSELVVVAVAADADAEARAAWLELAHVYSRLARANVYPERTLVFVAVPAPFEAGLQGWMRTLVWPKDAIPVVAVFGTVPGGMRAGTVALSLPTDGNAVARARAAFERLREHVAGLGAPPA